MATSGGWSLAVLLVVLGVAGQAHAVEERRVALIIGNDARAIERELKAAGFETVLKTNAGRKEMHNAIDEFGGKLATGSVGLFYYAGHGIQAGDKNYLIPVDADLQSEADLDADAIDAGKVMRSMEAARKALAQQSRSAAMSAQRKAVAFGQSVSDGFGVHTSPDGNRYEGEFRNNNKTGACVITYTSGYLFEGRCQDGLPNGYGVVTYPKGSHHDGRRYEGEFRDGHFSGRGGSPCSAPNPKMAEVASIDCEAAGNDPRPR